MLKKFFDARGDEAPKSKNVDYHLSFVFRFSLPKCESIETKLHDRVLDGNIVSAPDVGNSRNYPSFL